MPRKCSNCGVQMPPYVPRRSGPEGQKLCAACQIDPRRGYVSAGVKRASGEDVGDFVPHLGDTTAPQSDDGQTISRQIQGYIALRGRYQGQPGVCDYDESGEPYYEIQHLSGWTVRANVGPYLEIGHLATPGEAHEAIDVGQPGSDGHRVHAAMVSGTPEANHLTLARELDEFVSQHGARYASAVPEIKSWHPLQTVAHDSGDGQTVMHCPFCGSGQVLARSDRTIECTFCFSGETEFLTWGGMRTFKETVGTTQLVLAAQTFRTRVGKGKSVLGNPTLSEEQVVQIRDMYAAGGITKAALARQFEVTQGTVKKILDRKTWAHLGGGGAEPGEAPVQQGQSAEGHSVFGGVWVSAEIQSFGVQPLSRVTVSRQGIVKEIYATAEHRWFVHPAFGSWHRPDVKEVVVTSDLKAGDRLAALLPRTRLRLNKETTPSAFGIAAGFVFGDGSISHHGGAIVNLWGEKDTALLPYFHASRQQAISNANGTPGVEIKDLPEFFKVMPPSSESLSYLYGWLAGYFAADGSVGEKGTASLACADRGVLESVKTLCAQLGIGTYPIKSAMRRGFVDRELSAIHEMSFVASTLTDDFFVIPEHRRRFMARAGHRDGLSWTVVSVEQTDRVEEVFCAVVPGYENFTLADDINVMNCHNCFTIQTQPEYSAFPQTIDGQPVQVPGMPGSVGPPAPGAGAPGDPGAVDPDEVAPDGSVPGEDPEEDEEESEGGGGPQKGVNPFAAGLRTSTGAVLGADDYAARLALLHTTDRESVLARVKARRVGASSEPKRKCAEGIDPAYDRKFKELGDARDALAYAEGEGSATLDHHKRFMDAETRLRQHGLTW